MFFLLDATAGAGSRDTGNGHAPRGGRGDLGACATRTPTSADDRIPGKSRFAA
jgi:hypothetical protein